MAKLKFDPSRPHGTCHGEDDSGYAPAFHQDGRYFKQDGSHIPEMDPKHLAKKGKKKNKKKDKAPATATDNQATETMDVHEWAKLEAAGTATGMVFATMRAAAVNLYGEQTPTRKVELIPFLVAKTQPPSEGDNPSEEVNQES